MQDSEMSGPRDGLWAPANQRWHVMSAAPQIYRLEPVGGSRDLGATGGPDDGRQVDQRDWVAGDSQEWAITAVDTEGAVIPQAVPTGPANQCWLLIPVEPGYARIEPTAVRCEGARRNGGLSSDLPRALQQWEWFGEEPKAAHVVFGRPAV